MRYIDCSANDGTVESSLESQCCAIGDCTQRVSSLALHDLSLEMSQSCLPTR